MASKKTLAQRLFNICKTSSKSLTYSRRIPNRGSLAPDPGDNGIFSRFLHKRAIQQPTAATSSELRSLPTGESLTEKIKEIGIARDRLRLDGLTPPEILSPAAATKSDLTAMDAMKLIRAAELEAVKLRLREIQRTWIPYSEFVRICGEGSSAPEDQGRSFAKMLDDSGSVVIFGDAVILRPEEVAKAIQAFIIQSSEANTNDPRLKELEEMEKRKLEIDEKAESLVRKELWCGLGYLAVQTAGFMRLTFWELSWDVMEPICFYVTSFYFMAGYVFFVRTLKEPSFEGFFQSRYSAKQKRLMKLHNFDIEKYNELKKACHPNYSTSLPKLPPQSNLTVDKSEKVQLGFVHH